MDNLDDGGAAFPLPSQYRSNEGMTLRDYFAGQELSQMGEKYSYALDSSYDLFAKHCYKMADAMLKARKEVKNG